jgi:hypothetical protein
MAKPIKETPVLTGEDACHFEAWMTENESKKISPAEHAQLRSIYQSVKVVDSQYAIINQP